MKIKLKNIEDLQGIDEIEEKYETDEDTLKNGDITKKIRYFLENYDNLSNKEYYEFLCCFYDFTFEDSDYVDYLNFKTSRNFNKIIKLKTNGIYSDTQYEGHGKNFSYWTVKYRLCVKVAADSELENMDKVFTIEEIKQLISSGKVYPLYYFCEECEDKLTVNMVQNDIDYLIKNRVGKLDTDGEYFDYFMSKIKSEISLDEILMIIRKNIISLKLDLVCELVEDWDELEVMDKEIDKVIDCYNKYISSLQFGELVGDESELEDRLISKNPVEIVTKYIALLPNIDEKEWYQDITLEQIIKVIETIDYDEEGELCEQIQQMAIDLGEKLGQPELCGELASLYWADFERLENVVIENGDVWCNYYFARDYDNANVSRHGQVVIENGGADVNYEFARYVYGADIKGHGMAVIASGSVGYNYLFACDIEGADIREHYKVMVSSDEKDQYKAELGNLKLKLKK